FTDPEVVARVREALVALRRKEGIVLDLRGNGGGLSRRADEIGDLLVGPGKGAGGGGSGSGPGPRGGGGGGGGAGGPAAGGGGRGGDGGGGDGRRGRADRQRRRAAGAHAGEHRPRLAGRGHDVRQGARAGVARPARRHHGAGLGQRDARARRPAASGEGTA